MKQTNKQTVRAKQKNHTIANESEETEIFTKTLLIQSKMQTVNRI